MSLLSKSMLIAACAGGFVGPQGPVVYEPNATPPSTVSLTSVVDVGLVDPGIPRATLPVVEITINGRGPYRFGVETGAAFVGLSPTFAATAGLRRVGGTDTYPEYQVDSLNIGSASFKGFRATAMPRGPTGVDGILGLSLFRDVLVTIDYPAKRLRLSRDTLAVPNGRDIVSLTHVGPFWGLPVTFGDQRLTGILDTRGMSSLGVSPQTAAAFKFRDSLQVVGRASGAGIAPTDVKMGTLAGDVIIGAYHFVNPLISVRDLPPGFPPNPVVGDVVLRNFVVSLDQKTARLRLERNGPMALRLEQAMPSSRPAPVADSSVPDSLRGFVGQYGDRTIAFANGKLTIQRPGGPALELVSSGRDAFTIPGIAEAKIEFTRTANGVVDAIRVFRGGVWETAKKNQP